MSFKLTPKIRSLLIVTTTGIGVFGAISIYKNDEKFYGKIVMPVVHCLDPEDAHKLAIWVSKYRLVPKSRYEDPDVLKVTIFGRQFSNPVGIAAGFDKQGEAVLGLRDIGFGFVEIGTVTPEPQKGNEKPRVFRLTNDKAVINRYGFNSDGHESVLSRLRGLEGFDGILGVNLGKNKESANAGDDYVKGIQKFGSVADYLVVNISSPNTPGLRNLQSREALKELLKSVVKARNQLEVRKKPPLLIKLAPDLSIQEMIDVAEVISEDSCKIDGMIISNTSVRRPGSLENNQKRQTGGLSGKPLKDVSTEMISMMYKLTKGKVVIIGVGGIFSGKDAYEKIRAGASIVQLYTSLVYEGPPVVAKIKRELSDLVLADGYKNISECIGVDCR